MRFSKQFKRAFLSVVAALVFATMLVADLKPVEAGTTPITFSQSGGTSQKYSRDPSFSLEKDSSWITIKTSSPSDFTISASSNSTGKGRIGYVYVKRQGSVVTTYKIIQQGSTNLSVGPAKGSTSTYSKNSNQTVTTSCSWITLYKPNDYNVRMDYAANTTGSTRTGYVYVKEGSTTFTTYKITQSATVTVTYNKNGGSGSSFTRSIAYGSNYGKVDNPTRTGYNFTGWYTAASGGTQVTETTKMNNGANHTLYAHWSPKTFTVTFKDGSTTVSTKTVTYGSTYGTLPTRSTTGYTFNGWYTAASGGSKVTESTKVAITANQTLYAQKTVNSYTVTYNKNGGSGSNFTRTITYGSTYGKVDNPTRTGYDFTGWYTAASGGNQVVETTKMTTASNHTLYAHWSAKGYTVSFNGNGGSTPSAKTVYYDSTYGTLPSTSRTGYTFAGWYTAASGGSQITTSTKVAITANQTLYAHWTPKTFTVTLKDGSTTVSTKTVTYDSTYGDLPTRNVTGYTFNGWYTATSGGSKVTSSTKVTITANQTLYAQRTANSYTVTYDLNGGSGSNYTRTITYGSTYGKVGDPTRTGYEFHGWYTSKAYETQVVETTLMKTAANHTLYAKWTPKTFTVTLKDGSTTVSTKTVTYDGTYGDLPTRNVTGYTFNGWYTAASGGSKVTSSTKVTITANQTLYAQRTANSYTVTYDLNGGSGSNYTRSIAYGSTYGKVGDPTRTGYEFHGWYTSKTYETQVVETTLMKTAANHTLYAKWTAKTYTISFDSQGGSSVAAKTVTYDGTYGTLTSSTRSGYTFDGWYTAASGGTKVNASTPVTITANQTLYAHWTANKYIVTFDSNGGSSVSSKTVTIGSEYGALTSPTRTGYTFEGWYTTLTGGSKVTSTSTVTKVGNHSLYAHWTAKTFTVSFNSQGGSSVTAKSVVYDGTYGTLTTPKKSGYEFDGWYTTASGGTKITSSTKVAITANQTLYAHWLGKYTVIFHDVPGTSDGTESESYSVGEDFRVKYHYLEDEPFKWFRGWAKTRNAKTPDFVMYKNYSYTELISDENLADGNDANNVVHLYPVWTATKFTLRYSWPGGYQDVEHDSENDYLTKGAFTLPATVDGGYFIGWAPDDMDDTYLFSNDSKVADVLPLLDPDYYTLYAVYGYKGEAHGYILDSKYTNPVWADGINVSVFIREDYLYQLADEASRWSGITNKEDVASTDGYPLLGKIRNALYFSGSGYRLRDICQEVNSSIGKIDKSDLLYLEIRVLNTFDGVSISGVYKNYVVPRHDNGKWYNLDAFAEKLPSSKKTELSGFFTVSDGDIGERYGGDQGDYEKNEEFLAQLRNIIKAGTKSAPKGMTIDQFVDYRMKVFNGGICGPMAAVNVYLYFSDSDKTVTKNEVWNELLNYFTMENNWISWLERNIAKGDGWASMTNYLNNKLSRYGKKVSSGLEGIQGSTDKQLELTKKMISQGTPVIMSFYSKSEDCRMFKLNNNTFTTNNNTANDHYVIVTGIYESARGESIYLKVSSWGEEYYINWNEYAAKANIGLFSGDIGCGYIVIE